jgi:VCBS repeat-containing protein
MSISFSKDTNVQNNTAVPTSALSSATGTYTIELTAGSYNVTIDELVNVSGLNVTYIFTGTLTVSTGDAPRTYDILLDIKPTE